MLNIYPVITYDRHNIIDISKRFAITNIESDRSKKIYFWYTIRGWKSPENIAYDFYGSCDYVWVILALNNVIHPINDWLLTDEELREFIENKYDKDMYEAHHYEKDGILYTPSRIKNDQELLIPNGAKKVTNYEYEVERNESKRRIKILYPELLSTMEHEVRALFK